MTDNELLVGSSTAAGETHLSVYAERLYLSTISSHINLIRAALQSVLPVVGFRSQSANWPVQLPMLIFIDPHNLPAPAPGDSMPLTVHHQHSYVRLHALIQLSRSVDQALINAQE